MGKGHIPIGHQKIKVHIVYDVKPDGRRKARLVAAGYMMDAPLEGVYSSVVSFRGLRICLLIGELNNMKIWCTDVRNAYLESYTKEKLYIIAGPEFGELEGCTLIVIKALYGLKSSGVRWWERCSDILYEMGYKPTLAENDIWIKKVDQNYEYIVRYVNDLTIVSKKPEDVIDTLRNQYKLKLKDSGPIEFYLGCDFFRDSQGVLCMALKKYIERMSQIYERNFG